MSTFGLLLRTSEPPKTFSLLYEGKFGPLTVIPPSAVAYFLATVDIYIYIYISFSVCSPSAPCENNHTFDNTPTFAGDCSSGPHV